ncbi:SDR family NAD(P)-dependent oxidoreductase [Treponema sp. UBA7567]|uniref:SDR family NAD(P)-dependent oxidoreductase n=1 Tax=Treponema sp. UBA7567 TaxID=1947748 RepID=UPI0025EBABE9|nr:SDR family oxidoreductase [Treponema sp. UBA7567]
MKVLITGTSRGIGRAAALKFLSEGFNVIGLDIESDTISKSHDAKNKENYSHFTADISAPSSLPEIPDVEILVNNAGIQTPALTGGEKDIQVNLIGTMAVTQKYAFQPKIKSVLFNASVSALTGNEFPSYAASKAGIIGYMKNCAIRLANSYRATCNAVCFGGVMTELNENVIKNNELWQKIMDVTPLKRWASAQEAADWIYFLTVINKFCTGQAIDVSGGERNCADLFVW